MDINAPINYKWKLSWKNMPNKPVVNQLLKAILEKNVLEMENLFSRGADLEVADEDTFQRILYHVIDDYDVMKCIINHGFNAVTSRRFGYRSDSIDGGYQCYGTQGYAWDVFARAWYLKKFDVMELLASNGFKGELYRASNEIDPLHIDMKYLFRNNELKTFKILMENGYKGYWIEECKELYPNSKITHYLNENLIIKRKTLALDTYKFKAIPKPRLKEEKLFQRKRIRKENEILMLDYKDRLETQRRYINSFSEEDLRKIRINQIEEEEDRKWVNENLDLITSVLDDLLEE